MRSPLAPLVFAFAWPLGALVACDAPRAPDKDSADALEGPLDAKFSLPGFDDRAWLLHLPPAAEGGDEVPLVVAFHGGGGRKEGVDVGTCKDGDKDDASCLFQLADVEGFAVVAPDGTSGAVGRSWHAGGGEDGFRCVGGEACAQDVDDVAYVDALLAEVRRAVHVDDARVYATGISNGGAMSHRLACDRSEVFAAIASVAGGNQADASPGCAPTRPIPVLELHGTEDPCWGFDGTAETGACDGAGAFVGVAETMALWRDRNSCTGAVEVSLPDAADDGTSSARIDGIDCAADASLIRIQGGGHTWPGGYQYLGEDLVGRVAQDFVGTAVVWQFFAAHALEPGM